MASIQSDNVAIIHQVGEQHDVPYLAMEFLKGQSMQQWIKATDITPVDTIIKWGIEICDGLTPAHEQNLIHRDIKPANLWIEAPDNRIKILDFGLAYAMESDIKLTQTGHIIGTLEYMAPEQFESSKANTKTDLFSLGCVLYQLAGKTSPFAGDSQLSIIKNITAATPKPLQNIRPDIPYLLNQLIIQLLSKNPDNRPESAKVVSHRLKTIRQQLESEGNNNQASSKIASQPKRRSSLSSSSNLGRERQGKGRIVLPLFIFAMLVVAYALYQSNVSKLEAPADLSKDAYLPPQASPYDVDSSPRPAERPPYGSVESPDDFDGDLFPENAGFEPDEVLEEEVEIEPELVPENVAPDSDQENAQAMPPPPGFDGKMYPPPGFPPPGGRPPPFRPPPQRPR